MKNKKEHLDIDLEFLDKKDVPKAAPARPQPEGSGPSAQPNWVYYNGTNERPSHNKPRVEKQSHRQRNIVIGVVLFIGLLVWLGSLDSSGTQSGTPPSATLDCSGIAKGRYCCSSADSAQADALGPTTSEQSAIDAESASLDALSREIDTEYVNESSSLSVFLHNQKVTQYNDRKDAYNASLISFNAKVGARNNYLQSHCTLN